MSDNKSENAPTGSVLWKDNQRETLLRVGISESCVDTAMNSYRILLIERTKPCTSMNLSNSGPGKLPGTKPRTQDVGPLTLITMVTWNLVTDSVQMKMIAARQVRTYTEHI